jgi:hypothetical protein
VSSVSDGVNKFFVDNPLSGVAIAFGLASPFAYMYVIEQEHGIYIPETAVGRRSDEQNARDAAVEKERMMLYKHLQDDPVTARRKELAAMDAPQKQSIILNHALGQGIGAAVQWGFLTGASVLAAVNFSPMFRRSTGISARIAPVVIMTFGSFMLKNELVISEATKVGSDAYVEGLLKKKNGGNTQESSGGGVNLPFHEQAANWVYDYPFKTLTLMSLPAIAAIFHHQHANPAYASLKFSQKIMHTRVYGQAYVVASLALVMGFRDHMDREGRYVPQLGGQTGDDE